MAHPHMPLAVDGMLHTKAQALFCFDSREATQSNIDFITKAVISSSAINEGLVTHQQIFQLYTDRSSWVEPVLS